MCIVADPVHEGLLRAWADRSYTCLPIAHYVCDSHEEEHEFSRGTLSSAPSSVSLIYFAEGLPRIKAVG